MMRRNASGRFILGVFSVALSLARAQTLVIPQIADGGSWQTTFVLTNTSTNPASASLSFFQETGGGNTQSWNLALLEGSAQNLSLPGAGTLFLHTLGTGGMTTVGWAQLQASASVVAYAIFTLRVPGRQDQDGTAPAATSASRFLVPFDNSNGFATSVAIVNPTSAAESVSVGIEVAGGGVSQTSPIMIPSGGHMSFATAQQFAATAGQKGLAEFSVAGGGSISMIALRFNPTGAFTAAPVYAESGTPIIGGGGGSSGGTLPQFSEIHIQASLSAAGLPELGISAIDVATPASDGSYSYGAVNGVFYGMSSVVVGAYTAIWNSVSVSGQTLTFNNLSPLSTVQNNGNIAEITSGSLTVTLIPQIVSTSGNVTGFINLISTAGIVAGPFTGTYVAVSQ